MHHSKAYAIKALLFFALPLILSACESAGIQIGTRQPVVDATDTVTLAVNTPTLQNNFQTISEQEAFYINIQPQPGVVSYNRVEAFIQAHDFVDALQTALENNYLSPDELENISQLAANAEASLYNTGDWQVMGFARQIDAIQEFAARGQWMLAQTELENLIRNLPRRPQP